MAVAVRQPLGQPSAVRDREQLCAAADRERRQRASARAGNQCELPCVGAGVRIVGVLELRAVRRGVDVATAGEDQPVGHGQEVIERVTRRAGHHQR